MHRAEKTALLVQLLMQIVDHPFIIVLLEILMYCHLDVLIAMPSDENSFRI